jgi:hypothetical protein
MCYNVSQMAQNDVGSLLVYDKDKAGPGGEVPTSIDACVGIVTERGEALLLLLPAVAAAASAAAAFLLQPLHWNRSMVT